MRLNSPLGSTGPSFAGLGWVCGSDPFFFSPDLISPMPLQEALGSQCRSALHSPLLCMFMEQHNTLQW